MHNIVISGSNSFIGKHLIAKLSGNKKYKLIKMNRSFGDVKYANTWKKLPKARIIIHLAAKTFVPDSWKNPKDFFETNIMGTLMALEYCRLNKAKFIFLSSYLYGNAKKSGTNEKSRLEIKNPYSLTKKTAEDICKYYSKKYKLQVAILRPSNVYGPGQKLFFLIPDLIKKLKKKNFLINNTSIKRDLIHVYDLVDAIEKSFNIKSKLEILNIGSGKSYEIKKIINILQKIYCSNLVVKNKGMVRQNEILASKLNINKAKRVLKWKPKYNLIKGLKNTLYSKRLS